MHSVKMHMLVFVLLIAAGRSASSQGIGLMDDIVSVREDVVSKRHSSYDRSGGNADYIENIKPGETIEICSINGPGIITHIWFTINHIDDPLYKRNVILRMYWDNETAPSVESPIGDFFGERLG